MPRDQETPDAILRGMMDSVRVCEAATANELSYAKRSSDYRILRSALEVAVRKLGRWNLSDDQIDYLKKIHKEMSAGNSLENDSILCAVAKDEIKTLMGTGDEASLKKMHNLVKSFRSVYTVFSFYQTLTLVRDLSSAGGGGNGTVGASNVCLKGRTVQGRKGGALR